MRSSFLRLGQTTVPVAGGIVLGRSPECSFVLQDDVRVSRRHAHVWAENGCVMVEDLGSRNGVYLNGKRIHERTAMRAGDVIRLGSHLVELIERYQAPRSRAVTRPDWETGSSDYEEATVDECRASPNSIDWRPFREAMDERDFERAGTEFEKAFTRVTLRALSMGQLDESLQSEVCDHAFALASQTKDGVWINRLLHLHVLMALPMPPAAAAALPMLAARVCDLDTHMLEAYITLLRRNGCQLSAVDRQLCASLESSVLLASRVHNSR